MQVDLELMCVFQLIAKLILKQLLLVVGQQFLGYVHHSPTHTPFSIPCSELFLEFPLYFPRNFRTKYVLRVLKS